MKKKYFLSTRELIILLIVEIFFCISAFTNSASDFFKHYYIRESFWSLDLFGFVFRNYLYRFYTIFTFTYQHLLWFALVTKYEFYFFLSFVRICLLNLKFLYSKIDRLQDCKFTLQFALDIIYTMQPVSVRYILIKLEGNAF